MAHKSGTMLAMTMRLATDDELARWDALVAANPDGGNAMQTLAWGEFKSRWGWHPLRTMYRLQDGRMVASQWLWRKIPGIGTIWYCPKGPGVTTPADFVDVVTQTRQSSLLKGLWARFEPEVLADEVAPETLLAAGMVRANRDPGMKSTIFVDLSAGPDAVLASFNQSSRRNIRKAEAAGVTVEPVEATDDNLEMMYELMRVTEARAHYGLRPKDYFLDYWRTQIAAGQAHIFFARHEGEVLAGLFLTFIGRRAWYKDGGSFDKKREVLAPYLLQWRVMEWQMAHGITSYDMLGSPNRDQVGTGHRFDGLYTFKSKFNPDITEFTGCYDLPLSGRLAYAGWRNLGERIAARLANRRPERWLY